MENDKGKFFGFDLSSGRDTTASELADARKWHDALKTATVKIDDSDLKSEAAPTAPRATAQNGDDSNLDY
jgi:hypothetical protein